MMLKEWLGSMKTVAIFVICAQALIHFKPKGQYEKYIKLLVSLMLLIQLMEPIANLLGILDKGELQSRIREMEYKLESIGEMSYSLELDTDAIWDKMLQETEKEQLKNEKEQETEKDFQTSQDGWEGTE